MTVGKLKLIAPNSLAIVGLKLEDGSLNDFEYSYDDRTKTSFYVLAAGRSAAISNSTVLIDTAGNEWSSGDVEFHSLLHSR